MVRWEPGARERLQAAALELFATRGYEQTTAAEIAQSVGLTERTFFRHFSDKREVLFYGQQQFLQAFTGGVDAAPPDASPLEVIASALHAAASFFPDERRPYSRMRQSVIDLNPALRERELHKLANLAATVAQALRARGIGEPAATLAAQSGATVFGIAFAQWIREGETRSLSDIASDVLRELHTLTGATTGSPGLPIAGTAYEPARPHRADTDRCQGCSTRLTLLPGSGRPPRRSEEEHTAQIGDPSGPAAIVTAAEWPTDQNDGSRGATAASDHHAARPGFRRVSDRSNMNCQGAPSICLAGAAEWPVRGAARSSTSETKQARPAFGGPGCGLLAGTAMGALAGPPTLRV